MIRKDKVSYDWRKELANILVASWVFSTIIVILTLFVVSNTVTTISLSEGLDVYMVLLPVFLIISILYKFGILEYNEKGVEEVAAEKRSTAAKKAAKTRKRNTKAAESKTAKEKKSTRK